MSKGNARPHSQTGKLKFLDKFATGQCFPVKLSNSDFWWEFLQIRDILVLECLLKVFIYY